jgi:7-cyano-7-deazaguanine synthase
MRDLRIRALSGNVDHMAEQRATGRQASAPRGILLPNVGEAKNPARSTSPQSPAVIRRTDALALPDELQSERVSNGPEVLVLASGGIDSSALLALYRHIRRPLAALFVDYGQPAALQEAHAVAQLTQVMDIPLLSCRWSGTRAKPAGLIPGRNGFLLTAALMEVPPSATTIAIGVHSGTPYADCSPAFATLMESLFSLYGSRIGIATPFLDWTKADIVAFAREHNVPLNLTYSCETGGPTPCGVCASCLDRESLHVTT